MRMVAVVLGGGVGQRLGAGLPKQLLTLGGTDAGRAVRGGLRDGAGDRRDPRGDGPRVHRAGRGAAGRAGYPKVTAVIEGGQARPDSVRAALAAIAAGGAAG